MSGLPGPWMGEPGDVVARARTPDGREHAWVTKKDGSHVPVDPPTRDELLALLNTPEVEDFDKAVPLEAAHQVVRWGAPHDAGKEAEDWFWLVGYLAGKALHAARSGDVEKAKHHCISAAAALRNWHAHLRSGTTVMRPGTAMQPGIAEPDERLTMVITPPTSPDATGTS